MGCLGLKLLPVAVTFTGSPSRTSLGEAEHDAKGGTGGFPNELMVAGAIVNIQVPPAEPYTKMLRELIGQQSDYLVIQVRTAATGVARDCDCRFLANGQNESRAAQPINPVG